MSSESTASPPSPEPCASCGSPLAADQRYCLECGARRAYLSSALADGSRRAAPTAAIPERESPVVPAAAARTSGTTAVIAGVGVLLLAMGVGVLIGRSGSSSARETAAVAPVISVASPTSGGAVTAPANAALVDDWPSGTDGYTVQLQTLPVAGTQASAVAAAKSAASAKGVTGVGALKSDDYSSLAAGSYIVYAGVHAKRADAQKALANLKKTFPGATVVKVSNSSPASAKESSSSTSGAGQTPSKPAPPAVLKSLRSGSGGSYEQKSKNLPNVVSTG